MDLAVYPEEKSSLSLVFIVGTDIQALDQNTINHEIFDIVLNNLGRHTVVPTRFLSFVFNVTEKTKI